MKKPSFINEGSFDTQTGASNVLRKLGIEQLA